MRAVAEVAMAAVVVAMAAATAGVATAAGGGWQPPPQGAAAMFRQMERAFAVGGRSGGAGGDGGAVEPTAASEAAEGGKRLAFELAPMELWDAPGGPVGHGLEEGTVRLYRRGAYAAEVTAPLGTEVRVPPGTWFVVGEAPGWVTAMTQRLESAPWESGGGSFTLPVVPACRLRLPKDGLGEAVERLDVVSLDEAAVYPLVRGEATEVAVPAGAYLVYSVDGEGRISGVGGVERCEAGEVRGLALPPPPASDRWGLVVNLELPAGAEVRAEVAADGGAQAVEPAAVVRQGRRGAVVFADLPAMAVELQVVQPDGRPTMRLWEAVPGEVCEARWPEG